jgi:hypothetical protein
MLVLIASPENILCFSFITQVSMGICYEPITLIHRHIKKQSIKYEDIILKI